MNIRQSIFDSSQLKNDIQKFENFKPTHPVALAKKSLHARDNPFPVSQSIKKLKPVRVMLHDRRQGKKKQSIRRNTARHPTLTISTTLKLHETPFGVYMKCARACVWSILVHAYACLYVCVYMCMCMTGAYPSSFSSLPSFPYPFPEKKP